MFSFSSTAPKHSLEAVESELFTEPLTLCFRKAFHSWPTLVGLWYLDTSFTSFKRLSQCVMSDQNKTFLVPFNLMSLYSQTVSKNLFTFQVFIDVVAAFWPLQRPEDGRRLQTHRVSVGANARCCVMLIRSHVCHFN